MPKSKKRVRASQINGEKGGPARTAHALARRACATAVRVIEAAAAAEVERRESEAAEAARREEEAAEAARREEEAAAEAARREAVEAAVEAARCEEEVCEDFEHDGLVCTQEWERVELRCALSLQRLTDPAKGSACSHRACCNYQVLREYVGRISSGPKECPMATCGARLQRTRDVERDAAMCKLLAQTPASVSIVWLRGGEVRTVAPQVAATAGLRKRGSRKAGGFENEPNTKRRRSERRCVIVL